MSMMNQSFAEDNRNDGMEFLSKLDEILWELQLIRGLANNSELAENDDGTDEEANNCICNVWSSNLYEQFTKIRELIQGGFNYVAMDTEFPGIVAKPKVECKNSSDYAYQVLRSNVNILQLIQLGLTLMDENGNTPDGIKTWQFNFNFNLEQDIFNRESIQLLIKSGIEFSKLKTDGIDPLLFSELLISSGLVLNDSITWISFHSRYDFGYLIKMLRGENLPKTEDEFYDIFKIYFQRSYDIKYLLKHCHNVRGGLQDVANQLDVKRIGKQHQAGSDSLLTGRIFFRLKNLHFNNIIDENELCGVLFSLDDSINEQLWQEHINEQSNNMNTSEESPQFNNFKLQ